MYQRKVHFVVILLLLMVTAVLILTSCKPTESVDEQLQNMIAEQNITAFDPGPAQDPAKVALGQMLYFDKELSGNRDIACATCHHPTQGSSDHLPVSIGTGGIGLGLDRQIGFDRNFIPRNAPDIFNRGASEWTSMFWDSRISLNSANEFLSPAGDKLPDGLDNVLAVQAMFPVTSGDEMRGVHGDEDTNGQPNELAILEAGDLPAVWDGLMDRVLSHPEYRAAFQAAYPDIPQEELGFQHAANAIAAFEIDAYTFTQSPWLQYLNGNTSALSDEAKLGAVLFYGDANCASCHSGPLFTDQQHHNIATPQVGPGKGDESPLDFGRFRETGNPQDKYAFRTPPLHNVAASGPWMHDGAYQDLKAVILHHLAPEAALTTYEPSAHLLPALQDTFQNNPALLEDMLYHLDTKLAPARGMSESEINALVAFMEALTDPAVFELDYLQPASVPSGLPVEDTISQVGAN